MISFYALVAFMAYVIVTLNLVRLKAYYVAFFSFLFDILFLYLHIQGTWEPTTFVAFLWMCFNIGQALLLAAVSNHAVYMRENEKWIL